MLTRLISKIHEKGFFFIFRAIAFRTKRYLYNPKIVITATCLPIKKIGTQYGGKDFFNFKELKNATIISCGLGEDATFDIEFASEYFARVIMVDPTPRAIEHYNGILKRVGQPALLPYSDTGAQLLDAYGLTQIAKEQLILEEYALWIEETTLNFFAPTNLSHVSHSITNLQNNYSQNEEFRHISVRSKTIIGIIEEYAIETIHLLKLDIEGAEIDVITHMLEHGVFPTQICVEYDGLNFPSPRAKSDCVKVDNALRLAGYLCYYFDGYADYLYVLEERVKKELIME